MIKDHGELLYLPPELLLAQLKFQAKYELGKSNAGLLLLTKALYAEGCLPKNQFETLTARYSRKLIPKFSDTPLTPQEQQQKQKRDEKARYFSMVNEQWTIDHRPGWREQKLQEAQQYPDLPEAQELLNKYLVK